jgi:hypothetical protein
MISLTVNGIIKLFMYIFFSLIIFFYNKIYNKILEKIKPKRHGFHPNPCRLKKHANNYEIFSFNSCF